MSSAHSGALLSRHTCISSDRSRGTSLRRLRCSVSGSMVLFFLVSSASHLAAFVGATGGSYGARISTSPGSRTQPSSSATVLSAASWLPGLPQTCEDDFDCNDGKANYPLQCIDFVIARMCADPDDFMQKQEGLTTPAYVPLPVPVDKAPWD
eukprot:TRINITY_DN62602_c0_g1_i1.p2 TRINITY_DN62602_c0_g1~~TRINITY_DN62602_c0_g1_i1.p2  ORF type:complete len:167 (-),score=19.90 TRINITY_DN62602_c0_g1_i1:221-676(-)